MNNDLISRKDVINILEKEIFRYKKDLSKSYLLLGIKEQVEKIPVSLDQKEIIKEMRELEKKVDELTRMEMRNQMSDDLISRKALLEEIQSFKCYITGLRAGKGNLARAADEYRKSILQIIEDQPTAFDKEQVIEELTWHENALEPGVVKGLFIAIDIVEKGGIE